MTFNEVRSQTIAITLRVPVILMVFAATAIPVELRPLSHATLFLHVSATDVVENIVGYVPVGMVLGGLGPLRAVIAASVLSTFAETSQLVMMHRTAQPIDVATNVLGAILGAVVCAYWRINSPSLRLNLWKALVAAMLAFTLGLAALATSNRTINARGMTFPGTLEAYWKLDESRGRVVLDASGHGLQGTFSNKPTCVAGVTGGAASFDGATDYINFGHPPALRLVGSMTISAWINSTSFPVDDAAIVSTHNRFGLGYQLDTTVDRGLRTIGFKLADACGRLMARYGATPLVADRWYHVAGVYDAEAQTLNVYLNGKLDNGFLLGSVTGKQRSSRAAVYVGRRSEARGFEFAGSIDDVQIYSLALTEVEITSAMHGTGMDSWAAQRATARGANSHSGAGHPEDAQCTWLSDPEDARTIPGTAAALGVLVAVASFGLCPLARPLLSLGLSLAAGVFLLLATASTLPSFNLWTIPLLSLAGGASVAVSVRRQNDPCH